MASEVEESEPVTLKHPGVFIESTDDKIPSLTEAAKVHLFPEASTEMEVSKDSIVTTRNKKQGPEETPTPISGPHDEEEDELSSTESTSSETNLNLRPKRAIAKKSRPLPTRRKKALPKGKGRRWIFKKTPLKSPAAVARAVTSDRVYHQGCYYTKGDIVSVTDIGGGIYYGQLRGFLTDQYCEKSAIISWLLPSIYSPKPEEGFDPATYVIGPEEDLPRKLSCFTFVMHAPDDYFYYKKAPYPTEKIETNQEYLITRAGPKVRLVQDGKAFYKDSKIF
uniref:GATA zinc finger domaincontaining protein 1like [Megachile rotundata] n=1 Tax=Lepeophtheirus salmonis TaxID=72036 RepID=A0A0K2U889_LEPSM